MGTDKGGVPYCLTSCCSWTRHSIFIQPCFRPRQPRLRYNLPDMNDHPKLQLDAHPSGSVLHVRAQPGARRNAITGIHAGALKIAVTAAPEKGKANAAIVSVLCDQLNLSPSQVAVVAGETSRQKKLLITGISSDELQLRIANKLNR